MRQCRWLELLKDYNCYILYHPWKANVVVDALSRKSWSVSSKTTPTPDQLAKQFGMIQLNVVPNDFDTALATLVIWPLIVDRIKVAQENDLELQKLMENASQEVRLLVFISLMMIFWELWILGRLYPMMRNWGRIYSTKHINLSNRTPREQRCTKIWSKSFGGMAWSRTF